MFHKREYRYAKYNKLWKTAWICALTLLAAGTAGAFVNYVANEAEDGETNAKISEENREYRGFASEASGRRHVALESEGDFVTVRLTQPADALVIRYCVPDSEDGKGLSGTVDLLVDGARQELFLAPGLVGFTGVFPWNNDPSTSDDGGGHLFYDDVTILGAGMWHTVLRGEASGF